MTLAPSQAGVKLNTLLDLQGNIPAFARIGRGNVHDVHFSTDGRHQLLHPAGTYDRQTLPLTWQIELFSRWIKQHLRIKHYCPTA